jgi:hypothetical protein
MIGYLLSVASKENKLCISGFSESLYYPGIDDPRKLLARYRNLEFPTQKSVGRNRL